MNDFLRMCFNIITQIGPYLVVLLLLKYLVNLQQKRAKEREEEQKKGIIRTHYTIKTEKFLVVALRSIHRFLYLTLTVIFSCLTSYCYKIYVIYDFSYADLPSKILQGFFFSLYPP